ncbi:MAG: phage holin family protein [Desulfotomaculaceae bacterium]|nr:phage holin family protein [Desulfotomaculaceae bacterium]
MKWLVKLVLNSLSLIIADALVSGFAIRGFFSAMFAALVLGVVNTLIRPVLIVLTLPITFFTLGLFIFIINGLAFWLASWFVPGFIVYGFSGAFWGALITSIVSWVLNGIFQPEN